LAERVNKERREFDKEIRLRNHKGAKVQVEVLEDVGLGWMMMKNSLKYSTVDSRTLRFEAEVPANGETVITYTIRYGR
jgi:hypothetical protein